MYCVHLLFRFAAHNIYFSLRAKRFLGSSRPSSHSLPAQGKKKVRFIRVAQSLALEQLQRRLSGTSSSVLITTAICIAYANILYKPVRSLVRLFALKFCSNNQTGAFNQSSSLRVVIECSARRRVFRPSFYQVVLGT